jgi:pimeloyl-ACP methyl ester carboxylesterase
VSAASGIPILFESGGGDDATVWKYILKRVAAMTGTTLITYDRAGVGKSEMDPSQHGVGNGVKGLEIGLKSLGYAGDIMLVAHSLGGFYATLYASRNPQHVKAAVLIDANPACFFTDDYLARNLISLSMFETDGYDESSLIGSGNQKLSCPLPLTRKRAA